MNMVFSTNKLTESEHSVLYDALHYMKMGELRQSCVDLSLPHDGKKKELINRIITFVKTGKIIQSLPIPVKSRAKSYPTQPLHLASLMLYGSYKNDAKTRALFKSVCPYFHFTAFGVDWLNERWYQENPPTYQEFIDYWVAETERRKHHRVGPKDEWMFIRFLQKMEREQPMQSKKKIMHAWKKLQAEQASLAIMLLKKRAASRDR